MNFDIIAYSFMLLLAIWIVQTYNKNQNKEDEKL